MSDHLNIIWAVLRARIELLRRTPDGGYVSEYVLVTALVISGTIIVVGIVVALAVAKANSIPLSA
ncbi:hypothetical protein [Lentzea kentuckyensis]|uniref:hypothetical protein n=1 Tax=Lentzea kentuckyensis TaxID=360086 RepID=UPI00117A189A|nr:hypothetical protein [Lentzea kentuckyensis]